MTDLLDMAYINSLPQPLFANCGGGEEYEWPVYDIEVQCGLVRIDICGLLDRKTIGDVRYFRDDSGKKHKPDDFYADSECWIERAAPTGNQP